MQAAAEGLGASAASFGVQASSWIVATVASFGAAAASTVEAFGERFGSPSRCQACLGQTFQELGTEQSSGIESGQAWSEAFGETA